MKQVSPQSKLLDNLEVKPKEGNSQKGQSDSNINYIFAEL